jgi:hypothetical protein
VAFRHERIRARNDRVAVTARSTSRLGGHVPFLCECDDEDCDRHVDATLAQYLHWGPAMRMTADDHTIADGTFAGAFGSCSLYLVRMG